MVGSDVVDGVGCRLGRVDCDAWDRDAVEKGFDAQVCVSRPSRPNVTYGGTKISVAVAVLLLLVVRLLAAVTIGRTDTALGAFYRRLSARIGKVKAITATARKIAVLFYNALRHGMDYVDPGASSYETRYRARVIDNSHRRAKAFGFVLQPTAPAAVS